MPVVDSNDHCGTVLGAQVAPVLSQSLEDVPLEVAINGESDVTPVDGLLHQLCSSRETNAIGTFLVGGGAVDRPQTRVVLALHSSQRLIGSEHSSEVRGDRTEGVGALAHQIHLQPRVSKVAQCLAILGTHAFYKKSEVCFAVPVDGIEQLIGVCIRKESDFGHRGRHRNDLPVTTKFSDLPWVSAHVIAINICRQIVAKTIHDGPSRGPDNLGSRPYIGRLFFQLSGSDDLNIHQTGYQKPGHQEDDQERNAHAAT